jgi:hypothetical protein
MGWMSHDLGMNSRVHPKYKPKYRVSNWADYDRALVQRGDVTLWISEDAIGSWKPAPTELRAAQRKFSDHAIETDLTLRIVFKLPLRQAEGFLRSVLALMGLDLEAPDHTTLSRRSQPLHVDLHLVPVKEPIHLIVDRTALSVVGQGEWSVVSLPGLKLGKTHTGSANAGTVMVRSTSSLIHTRLAAKSAWHASVMPKTPASPGHCFVEPVSSRSWWNSLHAVRPSSAT